jgi:hypothetical protein
VISYYLVDKHNLDRNPSERKYTIYQILPLFKCYETTYDTLCFDWIETHVRSAKITRTSSNSGITLVDGKATRSSDGVEIWHLEVAGPPGGMSDRHTLQDTKKSLRTDVLNLVKLLQDHLDLEVSTAIRIRVFSTQAIG